MRFFFRSRQFKIFITVLLSVIVIAVAALLVDGFVTPQTNIIGSVISPLQKAAASVSDMFRDLKTKMSDNNELLIENEKLKNEVAELTDSLLNYEQIQKENEFYKNYLGIKDENNDFQFEPAMMIALDSTDPYGGFSINKGSLSGISLHDPVITDEGLVGYISEVGLSYSKVTTVLSPEIAVGVYDKRTRDIGAVSGTLELSDKGMTKMFNLTRNSSVTVGDYVVTSGGGIFPEGLLIGSIESVEQEKQNSSLYAVVSPAVDFKDISDMMVVTYFKGQGTISDKVGE